MSLFRYRSGSSPKTSGVWPQVTGALLLVVTTLSSAAIQFQDRTQQSGLAYQGESYGASWGSLDDDIYPDLFTSNHRAMVGLFRNNGDGTFSNRASTVNTWSSKPDRDTHGGGWGDFNRDGYQDLMVGTGWGNPNQFFVNENGQLVDRTVEYDLVYTNWAGRLATWLDYDNDGWLDFIMLQHAGKSPIFRQKADGFHNNTTPGTGFECSKTPYGQLLDVDADGRQDYICGADGTFPAKVYSFSSRPLGDITAGLPAIPNSVDTEIADFQGDLSMDVFAVRGTVRDADVVKDGDYRIEAALVHGTKSVVFRSVGVLTVDIGWRKLTRYGNFDNIRIGLAGTSPVTVPLTLDSADPSVHGLQANNTTTDAYLYIGFNPSSGEWTFRNNTNGLFNNIYLQISSTSIISGLHTTGFFPNDSPLVPVLLDGENGSFIDRTDAAGFGEAISCVSAAAADFDNDMDMDLYLVCRTGAQNLANRLYENRGDGIFDLVPEAGGAAGPVGVAVGDQAGTGDSVVVADYDVDGFVDLFVTNGLNMAPLNIGGPSKLYRNVGNANHWIELELVGSTTNRDGIGTKAYAMVPGKTQLHISDGRYHRWSQHDQTVHFGLAGYTSVDLRLEWPSGQVDVHNGVAVDQLYQVTEGGDIIPMSRDLPPPLDGSECGKPAYDAATEAGVFIWKNCATGLWSARFTAGPVYEIYSGTVSSNQDFTSVTPVSIESSDTLDTTAARLISYRLGMKVYQDGFDFRFPSGASVCVAVDAPASAQVYLGAGRLAMNVPFDLATRQACSSLSINDVRVSEDGGTANFAVTLSPSSSDSVSVNYMTMDGTAQAGSDYTGDSGGLTFNPGVTSQAISIAILEDSLIEVDETFSVELSGATNAVISKVLGTGTIADGDATGPSPCGEPAYDRATERAVVVWQNCTTQEWSVRFLAGGGRMRYQGLVDATQAFTNVTLVSIEPTDDVDNQSDSSQIRYAVALSPPYIDGFNFRSSETTGICFGVDAPAGVPVYLGAGRTLLTAPFNLGDFGPC